LHLALHRFARPWYQVRALRVFRDDASLPATATLWDSLERRLSSSRYLHPAGVAASGGVALGGTGAPLVAAAPVVGTLLVVLT
jgi:hypothetical protein